MIEWRLHGESQVHAALRVTLDETRISAAGDVLVPLLRLHFIWDEWVNGGPQVVSAHGRILAVQVELYPTGSHVNGPWVQTGLIPYRGHNEIYLPLPHSVIEELIRKAADNQDGEVFLPIKVFAMVRSLDAPGAIGVCAPSGAETVPINAVQWSRFLTAWGYPATRVMQVPVQLPEARATASPESAKKWGVAVDALTQAHRRWVKHDFQGAGTELRRAVQYAVLTWDVLWNLSEGKPDKEKNDWNKAVGRIGAELPGFKDYTIPQESLPNVHRVFGRLMMLKHFNGLANPFHHVGSDPVYTREDVDTLLVGVTAALRGMPAFWREFPSRNHVSAANSPSETSA